MFKNYIKVAWRNLWKNKVFSIINITGLAAGLACFLLISLFVLDELSFDKFFAKADRIYRINASIRFGGADLNFPLSSDMMAQALKKDYPQVEDYTRVYNSNGSRLVKKGNEYLDEQNVCYADSTFFRIFDLPVLSGDVKTALNEPSEVVISEKIAKKYFGGVQAAMGKTLETNNSGKPLFKVTAVIRDIPHNAHFNFDFFFSMKSLDYPWGHFLSHNFHTYLLLKKGTDYHAFENKFTEYVDRYCLPEAKQMMQINSMDDFKKSGNRLEYNLTPLTKIHLYSALQAEFLPGGNIQYVYIFSAVALFILLIACINFMNLTTARSANRAKEVGIRKVMGTERKELVAQFLIESTFMVILSLLIAIATAYFVLPLFNTVADKTMTLGSLFSPIILPLLIALPFVVGLLAGSYPAFFLSSFRPIDVLKGKLKIGGRSGSLRSILVVFQFATSVSLIIGTIVIYRQLHFIQTKNLGYDKNQVLIINDTYSLKNNITAFKNDLLHLPGVEGATVSSFLPVNSSRNDNTFASTPVMDAKNGFDMQTWSVDYDYFNILGMQIIKGRAFSRDFGNDSSAVIINETTEKILGFADPIGKKIYSPNSFSSKQTTAYTIIGVVKNFNYESLKQQVGPLSLFLQPSEGLVSFKIKGANIPAVLKEAEDKWKSLAPGLPFSYRFLDESFNQMYRAEERIGKIILIFSVLAILIACLGLFGLSTFIAEQRTKEIGIRKVLGASARGLVQLLSADFIRLVAIAYVIAAPLAWWFMNKWLQDFAYRIEISWWIFVLAAVLAFVIALATVSFQAIKAAMMNPVKSLRTE
jgi:putative ABC transport system permease protein